MDWTIALAFFAGGVAVGAAVTEWMGWPLHQQRAESEEAEQ
jgi:hypothetical protein